MSSFTPCTNNLTVNCYFRIVISLSFHISIKSFFSCIIITSISISFIISKNCSTSFYSFNSFFNSSILLSFFLFCCTSFTSNRNKYNIISWIVTSISKCSYFLSITFCWTSFNTFSKSYILSSNTCFNYSFFYFIKYFYF